MGKSKEKNPPTTPTEWSGFDTASARMFYKYRLGEGLSPLPSLELPVAAELREDNKAHRENCTCWECHGG